MVVTGQVRCTTLRDVVGRVRVATGVMRYVAGSYLVVSYLQHGRNGVIDVVVEHCILVCVK